MLPHASWTIILCVRVEEDASAIKIPDMVSFWRWYKSIFVSFVAYTLGQWFHPSKGERERYPSCAGFGVVFWQGVHGAKQKVCRIWITKPYPFCVCSKLVTDRAIQAERRLSMKGQHESKKCILAAWSKTTGFRLHWEMQALSSQVDINFTSCLYLWATDGQECACNTCKEITTLYTLVAWLFSLTRRSPPHSPPPHPSVETNSPRELNSFCPWQNHSVHVWQLIDVRFFCVCVLKISTKITLTSTFVPNDTSTSVSNDTSSSSSRHIKFIIPTISSRRTRDDVRRQFVSSTPISISSRREHCLWEPLRAWRV